MSEIIKESQFEGVNYYIILPAQVLHDNKLTPLARLIYGELSALANINGYAWISNQKLADKYEVSLRTINNSLSALKDYGYIRTELFYKENSKEVERREIYIEPHENNFMTPMKKIAGGSRNKMQDPHEENCMSPMKKTAQIITQYNNTSNNTVNNSNNNSSNKNKENQNKNSDGKLKKLIPIFEQEMGMISPTAIDELRAWLFEDHYEVELIKLALRESVLNRKVNMNYIKAILRNWRQEGVTTPKMVKDREQERFSPKLKKQEDFYIPLDGPWNGTEG
ncbi:hypothetical protein V425_05785 [Lactococcus lactis RTB018]|nr:DnaD domain protein [Lactococcus lactis]OAZ16839.1 hypothetical protein V425_05785 [Lactococcus lactis RTB018]